MWLAQTPRTRAPDECSREGHSHTDPDRAAEPPRDAPGADAPPRMHRDRHGRSAPRGSNEPSSTCPRRDPGLESKGRAIQRRRSCARRSARQARRRWARSKMTRQRGRIHDRSTRPSRAEIGAPRGILRVRVAMGWKPRKPRQRPQTSTRVFVAHSDRASRVRAAQTMKPWAGPGDGRPMRHQEVDPLSAPELGGGTSGTAADSLRNLFGDRVIAR
jgi:hypothetical protein